MKNELELIIMSKQMFYHVSEICALLAPLSKAYLHARRSKDNDSVQTSLNYRSSYSPVPC